MATPFWLSTALLASGILPLLAGPLLARWAERSEATKGATDAFIAVSMTGIVVLHIWPHAFLTAGGWTLVGGLAGLSIPFLLHGPLSHREEKIYPALVAVAFFGLAVHATLDGVALFTPLVDHSASAAGLEPPHSGVGEGQVVDRDGHISHEHGEESSALLALAVVLHRLPMGLAVWWLVVPILGRRVAIGILAMIAGATVLGFQLASGLLGELSLPIISIFEATVAGMLLHVVAGHEHGHHDDGHSHDVDHDHSRHHEHRRDGHPPHEHRHHGHRHQEDHHHGPIEDRAPWGSALGGLLGLSLILGLSRVHPVDHGLLEHLPFGTAFAALVIYSAPWLVLGVGVEWLRRRYVPDLGGAALSARSLAPPLAICVGLLGGAWATWMLGGILCSAWIARLGSSGAGASSILESVGSVGDRNRGGAAGRFDPMLRQQLHHHGMWMSLGAVVVALLEPLVRLDLEAFGGIAAFAGTAFLGAAFCRNPLFGSILAFWALHTGWRPELVATFLFFGIARWMLGNTWMVPRTRAAGWTLLLSGGGAVGLIWISGFLPARTRAPFHDLADISLDWLLVLQAVTLAGLVLLLLNRLFTSGFRALLRPIVDPAAEITRDSTGL